mmetsp:Transcript_120675/g.346725  ORF Transcript_120675/g.346725 Transcript_120675/m.346725 type:complete len:279 (-) Transcript_120675:1046-1882(-)
MRRCTFGDALGETHEILVSPHYLPRLSEGPIQAAILHGFDAEVGRSLDLLDRTRHEPHRRNLKERSRGEGAGLIVSGRTAPELRSLLFQLPLPIARSSWVRCNGVGPFTLCRGRGPLVCGWSRRCRIFRLGSGRLLPESTGDIGPHAAGEIPRLVLVLGIAAAGSPSLGSSAENTSRRPRGPTRDCAPAALRLGLVHLLLRAQCEGHACTMGVVASGVGVREHLLQTWNCEQGERQRQEGIQHARPKDVGMEVRIVHRRQCGKSIEECRLAIGSRESD